MRLVRHTLTAMIVGLLCTFAAFSQQYQGFKTPNATIPDMGSVMSSMTITDPITISNMQVVVDIQHPTAGDLIITLSGPTGSYVLSQNNGGVYRNYENTIFDNNTSGSIPGVPINSPGNTTALFRGVYSPQMPLPTSGSAVGTWTIQVNDTQVGDVGVLVKWGLVFNTDKNQYKDVRFGADLNYYGWNEYPGYYLEDVSILPPYSVAGARPAGGYLQGFAVLQNSKASATARVTIQTQYPYGLLGPKDDFDMTLAGSGTYPSGFAVNSVTFPGQHNVVLSLYQRHDLYITGNDNTISKMVNVTPGSLAYDKGTMGSEYNPMVNECNAGVYFLSVAQTLTSVDVWHGPSVELEPRPSACRFTIKVYQVPGGWGTLPSGAAIATFGPYQLPAQGNKWSSYAVPPTTLPAGTYALAVCLEVAPSPAGSFALGMDNKPKYFDNPNNPGGMSYLFGTVSQVWSANGGTTWAEEVGKAFATKMIRANFITGSDLGVVSIDQPTNVGSTNFRPVVTYGSFAPLPNLPTMMGFGRVTVRNASGAVVAFTEKRITMNPSQTQPPFSTPYAYYWQTPNNANGFDAITLPGSGSYTITAEVEFADDENPINNTYTRSFIVPFAPIVAYHDGSLTKVLREKIVAAVTEAGQTVTFVDRTTNPVNFSAERILWVGSISRSDAAQARLAIDNGTQFSVVPTEDMKGDLANQIYASFASSDELRNMEETIVATRSLVTPSYRVTAFDRQIAGLTAGSILSKDPTAREHAATFFAQLGNAMTTRSLQTPSMMKVADRAIPVPQSNDLRVEGNRIGSLSIANVVSPKAKSVRPVVNAAGIPTQFTLDQNYPNPFNPTTTISFSLNTDAFVTLRVYDMLGREVSTLVNATMQAGQHFTNWGGANTPSGVYLYRIEARPTDGSAAFTATRKMVLAR